MSSCSYCGELAEESCCGEDLCVDCFEEHDREDSTCYTCDELYDDCECE